MTKIAGIKRSRWMCGVTVLDKIRNKRHKEVRCDGYSRKNERLDRNGFDVLREETATG